MKVPLLQLIHFICIIVNKGGGEDQSCQNQTRAFKNWDRTNLPKHGENAQLCHQFEKGNKRAVIVPKDADLYCLDCYWDIKGALMAGASQYLRCRLGSVAPRLDCSVSLFTWSRGFLRFSDILSTVCVAHIETLPSIPSEVISPGRQPGAHTHNTTLHNGLHHPYLHISEH